MKWLQKKRNIQMMTTIKKNVFTQSNLGKSGSCEKIRIRHSLPVLLKTRSLGGFMAQFERRSPPKRTLPHICSQKVIRMNELKTIDIVNIRTIEDNGQRKEFFVLHRKKGGKYPFFRQLVYPQYLEKLSFLSFLQLEIQP